MTAVVIVVAIAAVAAVVVWFVMNRQHPENAAQHTSSTTETTSDQLYKGADRPAGPDAEAMDPDQFGGDQRPPSDGQPHDRA